jgi:hypothetical protein
MINPSQELHQAFLKWWLGFHEWSVGELRREARIASIRLRWEMLHKKVPTSFAEWVKQNPLSKIG